jgi:hypothetical protein
MRRKNEWRTTLALIAVIVTRQPVLKPVYVKTVGQSKIPDEFLKFGRFFQEVLGYDMINCCFEQSLRLKAKPASFLVVKPNGILFLRFEFMLVHSKAA